MDSTAKNNCCGLVIDTGGIWYMGSMKNAEWEESGAERLWKPEVGGVGSLAGVEK